jgi:hypothetical protein
MAAEKYPKESPVIIRTLHGSFEGLTREEKRVYGNGYKYRVTDPFKYWEGTEEEIDALELAAKRAEIERFADDGVDDGAGVGEGAGAVSVIVSADGVTIGEVLVSDTEISEAGPSDDVLYIRVPEGFLTDGSSSAPDIVTTSWLFHDYLYATHQFTSGQECTRQKADEIMITMLKRNGHKMYARFLSFAFRMNPFMVFSRSWRKSGERGANFY